MARIPVMPIVCAMALSAATAGAQAPSSASLTRQLTDTLTARHADAWAVRDPSDPARFIAALYVPGSQLLVVATPYAAPEVIDARVAQRDYRQAYIDLQTATAPAGRFFVQDMNADGFAVDGARGSVDIVYRDGTERTILNGDWKAQKLTEAEYVQRRADAEARYVSMLTALIASLEARGGAPATVGVGRTDPTPR
jgi:hypothetical protein